MVADPGYSSHAFREYIWSLGARPVIPTGRNEETLSCPPWIYTNRNQVERLWAEMLKVPAALAAGIATQGRLKEWRAVSARYEKTANSFTGILCLAASMDWLRR